MTRTKEDILKLIDDAGVRYIRLCFTDILGKIKGMSITRSEIEQVLEEGQGFDGSSVEGFARIEESDLMAVPDPVTFRIIPWEIAGEKVAMMFCDITHPDGRPYEGDPRYILRKNLKRLQDKGWTFYVGPEIEYFYFKNNIETGILDRDGYFDYGTVDIGTRLRKQSVNALEEIGIAVECSHHEVAPSQHEIDLKYQEALVMADFAQVYRFIIKEVAMENDLYATFMPKPIFGENGSGMHCHMSIFDGDKNQSQRIPGDSLKRGMSLSGRDAVPDSISTNDSGLMHIAAAMETPVVAILGPTNKNFIYPWRVKHALARLSLPCSPCFYYSPKPLSCKLNESYKCITDLGASEVSQALNEVLE